MVTLSSFRRRLHGADEAMDVELEAGMTRWLAAQEHAGENIGETDTVVIFIELKEPRLGGVPTSRSWAPPLAEAGRVARVEPELAAALTGR